MLAGCASPTAKNAPESGSLYSVSGSRKSPTTKQVLRENHLATVSRSDPASAVAKLEDMLAADPSARNRLAISELCYNTAQGRARADASAAIGYYLAAAKYSYPVALSGGQDETTQALRNLYNLSTGQIAQLLYASRRNWRQPLAVTGPTGSSSLRVRTSGQGLIDPSYFDSVNIAQSINTTKDFKERYVHPGIGCALVGYREGTPERRAKNPLLAGIGMSLPVNATLQFSGGGSVAELAFHDLYLDDHASINGRRYLLAADWTAPLSILDEHTPKGNVGRRGMLHPDEYEKNMGLYQTEPFRKDRVPVVLVHGLMSSPGTWMTALNRLHSDRVLRENYQFLMFIYPTGYPIPYNASGLRSKMKLFQQHYDPYRSNSKMRRMVLIAHSMGSNLTNFQIRDGGDAIWDQLFTEPIDQLEVTEQERDTLRELIYFKANPDISRVVFICGPHRGSEIASNPIGRLGSSLINFSLGNIGISGQPILNSMTPKGIAFIQQPQDSIHELAPDSQPLHTILQRPMNPRTTFHSVVGNRGKTGALSDSSDGVVPYWSSHLDGAASETVVPASHVTATRDPNTSEELRRILYLHIGAPYTPKKIPTTTRANRGTLAWQGGPDESSPNLNQCRGSRQETRLSIAQE